MPPSCSPPIAADAPPCSPLFAAAPAAIEIDALHALRVNCILSLYIIRCNHAETMIIMGRKLFLQFFSQKILTESILLLTLHSISVDN